MTDSRWEKYPNKWLIYNQILAVLLLMAGLLLFSLILYFKPLKAETIIRPVLVLEGIFALFLATALLSIACCLRKWMQLLQNRIWFLAILGLGLLFIHATADLADNLVIFAAESGLDWLQVAAKLFGIAILLSSIGLWIKDLLQTRQRLLASKQDLRDSEAKFRTLFELYPDATVLIDPQTALPEEFNQAAHEQLGYSAREFSRMNIADYEDLQKGIARGQSYASEFKIRRGDGEIRHIRAMAQPILDEQGSPVRVVGINEDVTKSKRAEERLHEQELLYRGLVESQQDLIVRVDSFACALRCAIQALAWMKSKSTACFRPFPGRYFHYPQVWRHRTGAGHQPETGAAYGRRTWS